VKRVLVEWKKTKMLLSIKKFRGKKKTKMRFDSQLAQNLLLLSDQSLLMHSIDVSFVVIQIA
jgi:hypothetical protein